MEKETKLQTVVQGEASESDDDEVTADTFFVSTEVWYIESDDKHICQTALSFKIKGCGGIQV